MLLRRPDGQPHRLGTGKACCDALVDRVPPCAHGSGRSVSCGRSRAAASAVMRRLKFGVGLRPARHDLGRRCVEVLAVQHVAAGMEDGAGGHVGVVDHQEAALAGVEVLVGLGAECAAAAPKVPIVLICPMRAHEGVGAILDHAAGRGPRQRRHHRVHVGEVAAHVGEQEHAGA